jgi:hypothetical protein
VSGAQIPEALAPGLDLFAAAWAEEWTRFGGFITSTGIGYPMDATGPGYGGASSDLPESVLQDRRAFDQAHFHGRMRGLLALLDAVPNARTALAAHMKAHSIACYHAGQPGAAQ